MSALTLSDVLPYLESILHIGSSTVDTETAKATLLLDDKNSKKAVKDAYLARVKDIRNELDFEQQLLQLNVARDFLLENSLSGHELVPVLTLSLIHI